MSRIINIMEDVIKGLPKVAAIAVVKARGENPPPPPGPGGTILGFKSRNNRTYTKEAIQAAVHKYEGVKVNLDHNTGTDPRKFSERFGRMVNVRMGADGLYGDLQYNPKHPLAEAFNWWIKNDPSAIGLSHNATAEVKNTAEGGELVTEIRDVDSVDLVADPATTRGIFESYNERNRQMNPDENPEMAPPPAINSDMDEAPVDEAIDEGDNYAEHLGNAIMAIVNDAGLSAADKRKKILGALKLMDDEGAEPVAENDEEMPAPAPEGDGVDDQEMEPIEEGDDGDDESAAMESALLGDEEPVEEGRQEDYENAEYFAKTGMYPPKNAAKEKEKEEQRKHADAIYGQFGGRKQNRYESINPKVQALMAELDAYRVQESLRKKRAKLLRTCKEAKIPSEAITTVFVTQLMKLKESAWPKLIADRKAVAKRTIVKPVSTSVVATDTYTQFLTELINS
jgi:hypothetical protein